MLNLPLVESESLVEIVHDLTGFDLTLVTKEDLQKETMDRATSPAETDSCQVLPETETIDRSEYEKVVRGHVEEMEIMRNEYELVSHRHQSNISNYVPLLLC